MALEDNEFGKQGVIGRTPLTAMEYMRAYYPEGNQRPRDEENIAAIGAEMAQYEVSSSSFLSCEDSRMHPCCDI